MKAPPAKKSVIAEAHQIRCAVEMIELGARLQLLQEETSLSRERLLKLFKEVTGKSPSKGMLPYSTDWFMTWQPNIHSSLFMGIYQFLQQNASLPRLERLIKSYRLYLEQIAVSGEEAVLSVTRAWFLVRFLDAGMLQLQPCTTCGGHFVIHGQDLYDEFVCGICRPPSRAGKTRKASPSRAALEA
ncbi:MAG: flagellar transcriptional regulator FlhC [Betaproteobacteria bacterium]|nr:flagellar transcriptional regulator FlhC [Betaproteobacteria bacterium]